MVGAKAWNQDAISSIYLQRALKRLILRHCTIFRAEVFAVWKAVEFAETRTTVNSIVNLYIDSQAAIKGITAYKVNSKLVNSSKEAVERLATNREHLLCYCPALCRTRLMYLGSTFYNSLSKYLRYLLPCYSNLFTGLAYWSRKKVEVSILWYHYEPIGPMCDSSSQPV